MNKSTLIRFGVAFLLLIVSSGTYVWWHSKLQITDREVTSLAQQIQDTEESLDRATVEKTTLESLSDAEASIYSHFVAETDIVSFLSVLESVGRATGAPVSITSVSSKKREGHAMLVVSAKTKGSFKNVMRTIGAIENVPYYVTMNTLTLSHVKSFVSKKEFWTAVFTLSVGSVTPIASSTPAL